MEITSESYWLTRTKDAIKKLESVEVQLSMMNAAG